MKYSDFTVHSIEGYISNVFLMEYNDKLLLVDSGCSNDVPLIEEFCLKELERPPSEIKLTVVSHNHPDHAGGACILRDRYAIPVAACEGLDLWYGGISGFLQHKIDLLLTQYSARLLKKDRRKVYYRKNIKPDFELKDGDVLPGFEDWHVFKTPGHTLYDIVLFNKKHSLLYASDTVTTLNGKINRPIPVPFPGMMNKSYLKLSGLGVETILASHGVIVKPGDSAKIFEELSEKALMPVQGVPGYIRLLTEFLPGRRITRFKRQREIQGR